MTTQIDNVEVALLGEFGISNGTRQTINPSTSQNQTQSEVYDWPCVGKCESESLETNNVSSSNLIPSTISLEDSCMQNWLSPSEKETFSQLISMFPDIDPQWVIEQLVEKAEDGHHLVDRLAENATDYPKLRDRLVKEKYNRRRKQLLNEDNFDVHEFLQNFPNPDAFFLNKDKSVSETYKQHAITQLQIDHPHVDRSCLELVLEDNDWIYALAAEEMTLHGTKGGHGPIDEGKHTTVANKRVSNMRNHDDVEWPDELDETFFREVQYVRNLDKIRSCIDHLEHCRSQRIEEAKRLGAFVDCTICLREDCLPEDMDRCLATSQQPASKWHTYCRQCIARHAEACVENGAHKIKCISVGCDSHYHIMTLKNLLKPSLVDLISRRTTHSELNQAGIEDLECCPFCDFMLINPNEVDKVFRCLNPECLRESCRKCKQTSHIPLKCSELFHQDSETSMRTYIENQMAEAIIRKCPRCNTRIIKKQGCNKMRCACGAQFCYLCLAVLDPGDVYAHFGEGIRDEVQGQSSNLSDQTDPPCPLFSENDDLHMQAALAAGRHAQAQLTGTEGAGDAHPYSLDVEELVDADWERRGQHSEADDDQSTAEEGEDNYDSFEDEAEGLEDDDEEEEEEEQNEDDIDLQNEDQSGSMEVDDVANGSGMDGDDEYSSGEIESDETDAGAEDAASSSSVAGSPSEAESSDNADDTGGTDEVEESVDDCENDLDEDVSDEADYDNSGEDSATAINETMNVNANEDFGWDPDDFDDTAIIGDNWEIVNFEGYHSSADTSSLDSYHDGHASVQEVSNDSVHTDDRGSVQSSVPSSSGGAIASDVICSSLDTSSDNFESSESSATEQFFNASSILPDSSSCSSTDIPPARSGCGSAEDTSSSSDHHGNDAGSADADQWVIK